MIDFILPLKHRIDGDDLDLCKDGLLSIGELSRITGIGISSLRYYDRIGALRPAYVDEATNYRYYSLEHLHELKAVRMCIDSGIALKNISEYIEDDIIDFSEIIRSSSERIEEEINSLIQMKHHLKELRKELEFTDDVMTRKPFERIWSEPIALWTTEADTDLKKIDRDECLRQITYQSAAEGHQLNPIYFGVLRVDIENKTSYYYAAGLKKLDERKVDIGRIIRMPAGKYRVIKADGMDIKDADTMFPDLINRKYNKYIFVGELFQGDYKNPCYAMMINCSD